MKTSSNIIRVTKSKRLRWTEHVARVRERRGAYRVLVRKPEGRKPLGRSRRMWKHNIKMDLRKVEWVMHWIDLAQGRGRWRAVVNAIMNFQFQ
jgi:hypothetical protein